MLIAAAKLKELSFTFGGKKYWMSDALFLPGRHAINGCPVHLDYDALCVLIVNNPDTVIWYAFLVVVAGPSWAF